MAKKPRYTLKQHDALGKELQKLSDRLGSILVELSKAYPIPTYDKARKAREAVDALRCELDSCVCKENPGMENVTKVYYRAGLVE